MSKKIRIEDLAKEIERSVKNMNQEVDRDIADISKDIAKKTVKTLRQKSPKRTGDYSKSWTSKKVDKTGQIIYVKDPEYRLTHLLENGHALRRGGRTTGQVAPRKHIEEAEVTAVNEFVDEVTRRLGY